MSRTATTKKEKMITRTFTIANADVLICIPSTAETITREYRIGCEPNESPDKILKRIKAMDENSNFVIVAIRELTYEEQLVGMPESKFLEYGTVLPPRKDYSK